jgi:hypothetical protein
MASLTMTIGALSSTVSADNTKATNLVTQYAAAIGAVGTNQQKLDAVVLALVKHMQREARLKRYNTATTDAAAAIQTEIDGLTWEA